MYTVLTAYQDENLSATRGNYLYSPGDGFGGPGGVFFSRSSNSGLPLFLLPLKPPPGPPQPLLGL